MAAKSSKPRRAGVCTSLQWAARSSRLPLRSSFSVNTWRVPAWKASWLTHGKFLPVQTTTAGLALPTKYSISALW